MHPNRLRGPFDNKAEDEATRPTMLVACTNCGQFYTIWCDVVTEGYYGCSQCSGEVYVSEEQFLRAQQRVAAAARRQTPRKEEN